MASDSWFVAGVKGEKSRVAGARRYGFTAIFERSQQKCAVQACLLSAAPLTLQLLRRRLAGSLTNVTALPYPFRVFVIAHSQCTKAKILLLRSRDDLQLTFGQQLRFSLYRCLMSRDNGNGPVLGTEVALKHNSTDPRITLELSFYGFLASR